MDLRVVGVYVVASAAPLGAWWVTIFLGLENKEFSKGPISAVFRVPIAIGPGKCRDGIVG